MKTYLSLNGEMLNAIQRVVAKYRAQEVGCTMHLQSAVYNANSGAKIGIRSRIVSRMLISTLLLLSICTGNAWGTTFTTTNSGGFSGTNKSKTVDGITVTFSSDASWQSGHVRVYQSGTISFSSSSNISEIVLNCTSDGYARDFNANTGDCSTDGSTITWSGSATSITLTLPSGSQVRISSIGVTTGAAKTLSSIAITTQPTKRKYVVGETFSSTGAGVTATYSDASTKSVTATWTPNTTLSAGTGQTITASYTEGGVTKTATTTVDVYAVTLQAKDEDGNAIASGGPGTPTRSGATITAAANAGNYVFKQWNITNASAASTTTTPTTITSPTAAVTVTAVYYKPITITYKANSTTFTTQTYGYGGTLAFPASNPDGATYSCTDKTFVGWVAEANKDYSHASTPPTYATAGGSVTAAATYYAVFADRSGSGAVTWDKVTSAPSDWSGDYVIVESSGANAMISDFVTGTSGEFKSASVTINAAGTQITSTPTDKMIWTFAKNGNNAQYSLKNKSTSTYAKITGTSSTNAALDASAQWFTIESTGTSGVWDVASVSNSARCFAWYSTNSSFRTYAKSSYNTGRLFKKSGDGYTYSNYVTTCGTCSSNPTVGVAALKGTFNASTIGVTCPTSGTDVGTNCSWTDYGFIWSTSNSTTSNLVLNADGTAPSGVTKVQVGTSGSANTFDGSITPVAAGTYYYRAYGKNGYASGSYQYSSSVSSVTACSVTFNMNDHGSAVATQIVKDGAKAAEPSAPTADGYRFDGWYTDNGVWESAWNFGTNTVTSNVTLYAKWTQVYTVTYNYNGGSGSCEGGSLAVGETVVLCASTPTKTASTFNGWKDQDGTSRSSNFTMPAKNVTLTAQWTDTEYTLTQTVGANTTKGHSGTTITSGMTSPSGLDLTYTISAANKALPKSITISGGGQTWTLGTNYTWTLNPDKHSATLHLGSNLTISANVIVTVTEQTRYTVVWDEHGSTTTEYYATDDNNVTMKGGIADCGEKKFYGWTENSSFVSHATTPPTMASSGTISGNKTYYAIYADAAVPVSPGYNKVTTISAGTYLIASANYAYKAVTSHVSASPSDGVISSLPTDATEVLVELGTGNDAGYFAISYDNSGTKTYIKGANKNLSTQTSAIYDWSLDISPNEGEIKSKEQSGFYLQQNTANGDFKAYAHTQTVAYMYKKQTTTYSNYAKTCATYDISITTPSGGTVSTSPTAGTGAAGAGQTVTVNVTPNSCKYLSALKYNDGSDHAISITSTPYTFTMPANNVTVTATFADKAVSSIAANTSTHRTLMQGTPFVGEQIRVTYNNGETEDLAWNDASLTFSGYNMSTLGNQTVSVAYSGSCGSANTTYPIEITDGIPVTYNDGNVTYVRKYKVGDIVGVDTITGKIGCNGYTFVGWSETEISSTDDEYVPVHNFTATPKTLYAVYSLQKKTGWMSIESAEEMKSGAEYMYVKVRYSDAFALANTASAAGSNYMAVSMVTSGMDTWRRTSDNKDFQIFTGNAPVASIWQVIKQSTNYYLYNADAAKYLKITNSAIQLTTNPDDNFSFVDGNNDCEVMIKSSNSNYYASGYYNNPNYYFNPYSSGSTGHYLLTRDSLFTTNPPCSPRSVTFHGNGGTVTAYGGGSSGGTLVVTEATRDAGINLPTASLDAEDCEGNEWNFFGWIDHQVDVTRVPILTTDMLNDGYDEENPNPHYDIVTDNDEFWAVYANTGEPETKYGTISFSMSDIRLDYQTGETEVTKTVTSMGDYTFGYKRMGHQSNQGIQLESGTGEFYNKTSMGKINSISFNTFVVGGIENLKVYVGDEEKATTYELTAAELQTDGSAVTYYPAHNCEYVYIKNYNSYVCVAGISIEFGQGTTVYATTPVCSTISLSGDVYVTSRNEIGIMAVTPLEVEAHQLEANADVVITSNSSDVYFSTDRTPNFSKASKPTTSVTVRANASGELDATPIYVHYKPSTTGTGAASDVTVYANLSTPDPNIRGEHTIHVRNLPEKVVIAAKVGGAYYALPADMSSATNPEGVLIDVNEEDMTATAPESCTYTIWPVKTTSGSGDRYALRDGNAYGERVRFSAVNNSNKGLWANNAASGTNINNYAAIAAISADPAEPYEWKITTTVTDGKWSQTLQTDQTNNTKYLRYWAAASGGPKWGTYANGEQNLYLLPVTEITPFEMEVVEWYPTKVLVNTASNLTGNTPTICVNGAVDSDAKIIGKGSNLYEISQLDLAGNPTKSLRVDYGTSPINSCTKAIPVIISRSTQNVTAEPFATLTKEIYSKADLVVRDSAVLTMNGTQAQNTFNDITIYPTAKISVPSTKKLTVHSLTFFGGIDEIYNGTAYTVNKYGVPELSLKGTLNKSVATINYDMRVDLSQMYALALPYDVALSGITYWDGTTMTPGTDLYISAYDGQARANRENKTWIYEEDFEDKLGAATLKAGVGYTISAELQSGFGNTYSIIRMPMTGNVTNDGTETAKTVAVKAYVNTVGETVTDNHKGWNFVGNPYMATISGGEPDTKLILGKLVPNTEADPYDGSYIWDGTTYPYRYVTIPSDDGTENEQAKWADVTLRPFKNFFIQVGKPGLDDGETGDLSFALESRADAPARYAMTHEQEVEFEIRLSNTTHTDHTGLLIAEAYSPAYEINADLEKMENPMSVYTLTSGYKLAYNALSPNDAKQPIPVGYIANEAGGYTFQLDERSDVNEVEHIWLTDYELDHVTDLMDETYSFTTIAGRNETRFALTIELRTGEEIATDIGTLIGGADNDGAVKFIWQDKMYILNHGVIYESTGKRVNVINK